MNEEPSSAGRSSGVWVWIAVFVLAAGAFVTLPIFECDACRDLAANYAYIDIVKLREDCCPSCGNSRKHSLFHKWFGWHEKRVDDPRKALTLPVRDSR